MGNTLSPDRRYVILVRHASRDFKSNPDESKQKMLGWRPDFESVTPDYEEKGLPLSLAIAHRLADELGPVRVTHIWHSPHAVANQTALAYQWVIEAKTQHPCSKQPCLSLDPDKREIKETAKSILELAKRSDEFPTDSAIIVVGHQPSLTMLARRLTNKKLPAGTLPLGGSEAACLEMQDGKTAKLLWMLTEKSSDLLNNLREKIKSKYDVAKFFLGAFVVNTGFVLSGEIWKASNPFSVGLVFAGFFLTLVALALTAATLMSYDALLMPSEFWTESSADDQVSAQHRQPNSWSVLRPPSQAQIVLFYEMVHVWTVFFIPALSCAFAAVATFLVALAHNSLYPGVQKGGTTDFGVDILVLTAVVAAGALILPLVIHYRPRRPNLGFED